MQTKDIVYIALFCALTAALGLLPPINVFGSAVPITAQTLGVMLAGGVLGAVRGGLSQLLFVLLVVAGLPLLSGGRGGIGVLQGASGGFLISFAIGAFVVGLLVQAAWRRLNIATAVLACMIGGILAVYPLGIWWWSAVAGEPFMDIAAGALVYLPGDLAKAVLAGLIIIAVKQAYPLMPARSTN